MTNLEFLQAIFGKDYLSAHVTDFMYDPAAIPADRHLMAWKGDYFSRYTMTEGSNQYFTISLFYADDQSVARRRKALFRKTPCIVLDDVREKLPMSEVDKLPEPSWILETSKGSEQWGYILETPCEDRGKVENLLDGLVANGLAPGAKDPGMKGVTRYVRLPEGYNRKASKQVDGKPVKCEIKLWNPAQKTTIEKLAAPFNVDLDAPRREARVDGAANIENHPLIDAVQVKSVLSDGRYDIICPWVTEHTGGEDTGSVVFTNANGSIGFKCHHGSCQERTGADLLNLLGNDFKQELKKWQMFKDIADVKASAPSIETDPMQVMFDQLRRISPNSEEARATAASILKHSEQLPVMDRVHYHDLIKDVMQWNQKTMKDVLTGLREEWYESDESFFEGVVFIRDLNQFYERKTRIFFTPEAFQNSFGHEDNEARKSALLEGRVNKVDRMDYAPGESHTFEHRGISYCNTWCDSSQSVGVKGDVTPWLDHFRVMGFDPDHLIKCMAFTIKHPEQKINHIPILASREGCGKDFLIYPLLEAMGDNGRTILGDELDDGFNDFILGIKFLLVNETDLAGKREARAISNKLKPLAAAPPERLRVNQKNIKAIDVRNIVNVWMTTNSKTPILLDGASRRFYPLWSDLNVRNPDQSMGDGWAEYFTTRWDWMRKGGGWQAVVWYLLNEVDLEGFDPGQAPPVTMFLRDIQEASLPDSHLAIVEALECRMGEFNRDLVTTRDLLLSIKTIYMGEAWADKMTSMSLGRILGNIDGVEKVRATGPGRRDYRLWILRGNYEGLSPTQLYELYNPAI